MTSDFRSQISRLEREIARLDKDAGAEAATEADLIRRINRARDAASRATSPSTTKSRLREVEQYSKRLADARKKQSDTSSRRARLSKSLLDYRTRQSRADEAARKKIESSERKLMREREAHQRRMSTDSPAVPRTIAGQGENTSTYDFFICHASEDKDQLVRELAELLRAGGAIVWYDEFTLSVGSRLRREIDRGLLNSRFGIVVVSEHFFAKDWPQTELDGLFALGSQNTGRILPVWHRITKDGVAKHSPILADIIALNTGSMTTNEIAEELLKKIQ